MNEFNTAFILSAMILEMILKRMLRNAIGLKSLNDSDQSFFGIRAINVAAMTLFILPDNLEASTILSKPSLNMS